MGRRRVIVTVRGVAQAEALDKVAELEVKAVVLVDSSRGREHVVLENVAISGADPPILRYVNVGRREVAGRAGPAAVQAADGVDDARAAVLDKGLGRQAAGVVEVVEVALVRRDPSLVATILVDLGEQLSLQVEDRGLGAHVRARTQDDLGAEGVPGLFTPAVSDPSAVERAVADLLKGPVLGDEEKVEASEVPAERDKRVALEECVAVVGDVEVRGRRVERRDREVESVADDGQRERGLAVAPRARLVLDRAAARRAAVGLDGVGDDAHAPEVGSARGLHFAEGLRDDDDISAISRPSRRPHKVPMRILSVVERETHDHVRPGVVSRRLPQRGAEGRRGAIRRRRVGQGQYRSFVRRGGTAEHGRPLRPLRADLVGRLGPRDELPVAVSRPLSPSRDDPKQKHRPVGESVEQGTMSSSGSKNLRDPTSDWIARSRETPDLSNNAIYIGGDASAPPARVHHRREWSEQQGRGRPASRHVSDWQCPNCPNVNFARRDECNRCGTLRPARMGVQPRRPDERPRKVIKAKKCSVARRAVVVGLEPATLGGRLGLSELRQRELVQEDPLQPMRHQEARGLRPVPRGPRRRLQRAPVAGRLRQATGERGGRWLRRIRPQEIVQGRQGGSAQGSARAAQDAGSRPPARPVPLARALVSFLPSSSRYHLLSLISSLISFDWLGVKQEERMQQHYWLWVASVVGTGSALYVGVGKADATGPPSDYIFMGMAKSSQIGTGLQMRMYARAFVFVDDSGGRAAYVSLDSGMVGYVLKKRALEALNMSEVYNETNVAISGTHSHSGPSGFLQHEIFQLAGSGWVPQTIDAMAGGIAAALALAHEDVEAQIAAGAGLRVMATQTTLENASISRSPSAYLNNPEEERAAYDGDTDNDFTFLGISNNETLRGIATWFAVHGTSMNNTNTFVSSDNKGYASVLMERKWPGSVAAFGSANLGDVSPNILGAFCQNTGEPCDFATSTCPVDAPIRGEIQRNEPCSSVGPGKDMFASTAIIGERQAALAAKLAEQQFLELEDASWVDLSAARVEYRHSFVKMPRLEVYAWDTGAYKGTLCDAALGDAFAAGTVDGPGAFDFAQNSTSSNPLWPIVTNFLHETTPEAVECQHPKTILLPTGNISVPNPWSPSILPMQLLKIGSLVIAAVPTEMTTMAGRRLKAMLAAKFANVTVVIAGLSNEYADYTTTYEEYQAQRYEGGSTIYGPYQLDAYLQEYAKLADAILSGEETPAGPTPEDFSADLDERFWKRLEMLSIESPPSGYDFGDVLFESWNDASALVPGDVVAATFVGADLNNDLKTGATYLEVHYLNVSGWTVLYVDADPETRIDAAKKGDYREVRVRFDIPATAPAGTYRLVYYGDARTRRIGTHVKREAFNATSSTFQVATGS